MSSSGSNVYPIRMHKNRYPWKRFCLYVFHCLPTTLRKCTHVYIHCGVALLAILISHYSLSLSMIHTRISLVRASSAMHKNRLGQGHASKAPTASQRLLREHSRSRSHRHSLEACVRGASCCSESQHQWKQCCCPYLTSPLHTSNQCNHSRIPKY